MKMSKYSDDFFREYEEIYSDSERRNENRSANRGFSGRNEYDRNHRSAHRNSIRGSQGTQRPREFYDYESGDNYDRNDRQGETYRTRSQRTANAPANPRPKNPRPTSARQQYKLPRAARRAIMIGVLIVFVVGLLSGLIAIVSSATGGVNVDELKTTQVAARQVALSWDKAKKAEGYRVMLSQGDSEDYHEYQLIDDPDTCEITVSDLDQATRYNFSVTAVRGGKDIGKPAKLPTIWTKPDAPEITNLMSTKKGEIYVDWSENDKAEGYILEYKKDGGEYTADATLTFSASDDRKTDITGLETGATYTVRMSSYFTPQDQLRGDPGAEQSVKVVAEDTPAKPKAPDQKLDGAIDPTKPMIALTFDDGPLDGGSGEKILDVLEQHNAKATFFMVGCNVTDRAANLQRKVKLKMELGNHTWNHARYGQEVTPEDISKASNEIYSVCGQYPTCFRSPGGMTTGRILQECEAENMPAYYWSIDTQDWSSKNADAVYHAVVDNVQDGDIVLMHEIYDSTADAVERMVPELIDRGFQLVTCHALVTAKGGAEPVPGKQYSNAFNELPPAA